MSRSLVVRIDSAGDVILAGPAVRAAAASGGPVSLLCGPRGLEAARLLPDVDELLVWRAPWIDHASHPVDGDSVFELIAELSARDFGAAAVLSSQHQDPLPMALLLRLAGVRRIAAITDDFAGSLLDHRLPEPGEIHEVERNLLVGGALGWRPAPGDAGGLDVSASPRALTRSLPERFVVLHPGASSGARAWPAQRHRELLALLASRGHPVVVTGGPGEADLALEITAGEPDAINLAGQTTLEELAVILGKAQALVVGNTGPAHLAAAVGTPVISIFALTVSPARWRPWRVPNIVLSRPVPCSGCRARECPVDGHPCISGVEPADVLAELELLVGEAAMAPPADLAEALPR